MNDFNEKEKERNWKNSKDKVKKFWEEIRNKIISNQAVNEYNFIGFVFPEFEKTFPVLSTISFNDIEEIITKNNEKVYRLKKGVGDINFWKAGKELVFDKTVNFNESIFQGSANFSYLTFKEKLFFNNSVFQDKAHFKYSFFHNRVHFWYTSFNNAVSFSYSNFKNGCHYSNATFKNIVWFHELISQKDFSFGSSTFENRVDFYNSSLKDKISFKNSTFQSIVSFSHLNQKEITTKDKNILILYRTTFYKKSYIDFNNCEIKSIKIENLQNYSNFVKFTNIKILENLTLRNSNLTKIEFHNLNLTECKTEIENVSFIGHSGFTIFNNVKWGKNIKGNRDTFRQLKYVNDKQGNIIEANKFYSIEMKKYKEDLKEESCKTHCQDKIVFFINEKVSNFSQSWLRPLIWFFIVGLFFFLLSYIDKINSVTYTNISLKNIGYNINEFFKFINPFKTVNNNDFSVWWLLNKILSVYIIYQFIVSLRKQTRRK